MPNDDPQKWLLLIHQIPPKPNALRVKIWRRLQQVGAVAIKQSVYAMPLSEESREDLSWILKEIAAGGGDGSISEVRFLEGLNNEQIVTLFLNARRSDYEKIIQDATLLLNEWSSGQFDPRAPEVKGQARVSRLQRRLEEVAGIDFFRAALQETAKALINELAACLASRSQAPANIKKEIHTLEEKIWVTRKNLFVDRIACIWLIQRFVDSNAVFKFIDPGKYTPQPGEICFDMFEGEFTHRGDLCTFEVMIHDLGLGDQALAALAQVVHDIDLKDKKHGRPEANGFNALLTGLVTAQVTDEKRMTGGFQLFENLYTYFQQHKGQGHSRH